MTIYLDVIWLLNLCIDFLLIMMTAIALKRPIRRWRFGLGALVASTIVFLLFTPLAFLFYQPWMKVIFSMGIVLIAFGYKRFTYFLQNWMMFYFVTFMTGGGLFALHFFWQTDMEILDGITMSKTTGFGSTFSWIFVMIGFPLVWYFSKQQIQQIETKKIHYAELVAVEIGIDDFRIAVKGLIDSGNQLHDPITKAPVMIIERNVLKGFLSDEFIDKLANMETLSLLESEVNQKYAHRMRVIPYRAVGNGQQFLIALKPDYVKVIHNGEEHYVKKVLIGINQSNLSNDGEYQCIVHPKMLISTDGKKLA